MRLIADLGEGIADEELLLPYLHMAAVSCGAHAGEERSIRRTIRLCAQHNILIGAHPSFIDRDHFGRMEQSLSGSAIEALVIEQLELFRHWALEEGANVYFVKPHGALYNLSARDRGVARSIASAVKTVKANWLMMGLAGSHSLSEASAIGIATLSEAFADRRYRSDGQLCPRSDPKALIGEPAEAVEQVRSLFERQEVLSVAGDRVLMSADAVCVHGDGPRALDILRSVRRYLDN